MRQSNTYVRIVSLNNQQTYSLKSNLIGRNEVQYAYVVIECNRSSRFHLAIDTYASISCLSVDFF